MEPRPINMLVIEDDQGDYEYLTELLAGVDNPVFEMCHNTRLSDGLKHLASEHFDVILSDLHLPDSQGFETVEKLRTASPQIPIILLTGQEDDDLALSAVKAGAQDYLVKGQASPDVLVRAIRYAIERNTLRIQLEEVRKTERFLAYHDQLTRLPNREFFFERLNHVIAHAKRYKNTAALLFLDLDNFKTVNDRFGHAIGDALLKSVADRLRDCVRESDTVVRLAGDEFTIILERIERKRNAAAVAKKILHELNKPFILEEHEVQITCSIGISLYPHDAAETDKLIRNADMAMYRAKRLGVNNYLFFAEAQNKVVSDRLHLEDRLKVAIDNGEMVLHYQPQVDLSSDSVVGLEALVRWPNSGHEWMPPSKFIPIAEETGLIRPLGRWVLRNACEQTQKWTGATRSSQRIAVNISARQFNGGSLVGHVSEVLQDTGLDPGRLVLEITESSAMQNVDYSIKTLKKLKDLGVLISLDDFGVGYASLNYLKKFPLDVLKVDRSFVDGLRSQNDDWVIISAVVSMAHRLGLQVVAEGVETERQLAAVRSLGCDVYQGFLHSRAMSVDDCTNFLRPAAQA